MDDQVTLIIIGGEIKPIITLPSSSTIRQLKRMIKKEIGVPVHRQRLLYHNIRLLDNTIINDYIHGAMAEVLLSVDPNRDDSMISIYIWGENFFKIEMIVSKVNKVIEVKEKFGQLFSVDPKDMDLWHLEKKMEDNKMLYEYYVDDNSDVRFTRVGYSS